MKRGKSAFLVYGLLLSLMLTPIGCGGGGGGGGGSDPAPNFSVDSSSYDFGTVTVDKTASIQIQVKNTGDKTLTIDSQELSGDDAANFDLTPGTCTSISAGEECSVVLTFTPTDVQTYNASLDISSNDGDHSLSLTGEGTDVSALTVTLNQVVPDCDENKVKAYVSVTDQNNFAVTDLSEGDFTIKEEGVAVGAFDFDFVDDAALTMAAALVLDYSLSVRENETFFARMKAAATEFVNQMLPGDEGEIIKFATEVEVTQVFTTDTNLLTDAIADTPDIGTRTALYDAIGQGVEDAAGRTTNRKAVIVLTDGVDWGGDEETPGSTIYTKDSVIALAQAEGIPIYTIGVGTDTGDLTEFDPAILEEIATETGGQYFEAPTSEKIQTIYAQLSEIINNQYVLTYTSAESGDVSVVVTVADDAPAVGVTGGSSDPMIYTSCP